VVGRSDSLEVGSAYLNELTSDKKKAWEMDELSTGRMNVRVRE